MGELVLLLENCNECIASHDYLIVIVHAGQVPPTLITSDLYEPLHTIYKTYIHNTVKRAHTHKHMYTTHAHTVTNMHMNTCTHM